MYIYIYIIISTNGVVDGIVTDLTVAGTRQAINWQPRYVEYYR